MESTAPPLARTAPTDGLHDLFDRPGPFLTVVLDTQPDVENAAHLAAQRWRAQRDEAQALGVPEAALAAVDDLVADAHHGGPALFVVADGEGGEPLLVEHLAALPSTGATTRWGPLPSVVPLLADRQARLPHVIVRCDREGADILAVDADGRGEEASVKGGSRPYRHARSVGWRERAGWDRAQRHLAATAEDVARLVADAAAGIDARLAIVAGDDRTVDEVVERLASKGVDARPVAGGRGHDGSEAQVDEAVATIVHTVAAEHEVTASRRFRDQVGTGLAVEGEQATAAALAAGQVDVLLVHDDGGEDRAVDGAVRGALATSASVVVLPAHAGPRGGIGALLRWS